MDCMYLCTQYHVTGYITSSFSWALSLHASFTAWSIIMPTLVWELFLVGNQCDNTLSKLQIFKGDITFIIPELIDGVRSHAKGA